MVLYETEIHQIFKEIEIETILIHSELRTLMIIVKFEL